MVATKTKPKKKAAKRIATKARDRDKYIESSIAIIEGSGRHGTKYQPFSYEVALKYFMGWVYTATILNANAAASVPLRLYVRNKRGTKLFNTRKPDRARIKYLRGDLDERPSSRIVRKVADFNDDFEEVTENHPVLDVLQDVNPWMNGFDLTTLRFVYLQLTGNAYLHPVVNESGIPEELWIMPSQWVEIMPGKPDTDIFIDGYYYGKDSNIKQEFMPEEVIHFKLPNPRDIFYGMGKIEAGWNIVQQDKAAHIMDLSLYQNHARPDYAVLVKSGYNEKAFERAEQVLNDKLQGPRNAGKFVTFSGDTEIIPLAWPPKDLGGKEEILEEIAGVFGVPITKLKANDPNRSNAEQGDAGWMKDTILPMIRYDEDKLNEQYLPMFGIEDDAFLAYDNPVPKDRTFERETRVGYVTSGIITRNEARQELGMDDVEGGDELLVPQGTIPIDQVSAMASMFGLPPSLMGNSPQRQLPAPPKDNSEAMMGKVLDAIKSWSTNENVKPVKHIEERAEEMKPEEKDKEQVKHSDIMSGKIKCNCKSCTEHKEKGLADDTQRDEERENKIRNLQDIFKDLMLDIQDDLFSKLELNKRHKSILDRVNFDKVAAEYTEQLTKLIKEPMAEILGASWESGVGKLGMDVAFDVSNPEVVKFMEDYTVRLARNITENTVNQIKDRVALSLDEGMTINQIKDVISETPGFMEEGIRNRAEMIARTESARAYVEGELSGWESSGVVAGKQWLLAPNACQFCKAAHKIFNTKMRDLREVPDGLQKNQPLVGTEGNIMVLDYEEISGPPLHPNCRCDVVPVLN